MKTFFFIIFFVYSLNVLGQQSDKSGSLIISGIIVDSVSKQPLEYATISAFLKGGTAVVGGGISDSKGKFTIDNLGEGQYDLKIDFIGYQIKYVRNISISANVNETKLGSISISQNSKTLTEVTITGAKNFVEFHLDKMVVNVEKDITSQGGMLVDVLKKTPQVSVDVDGNVELLGSTNVRVFINGKPSILFDNNLAEALQTIPASQIKTIEIITSPGAQYDAQGTGGIINIVLKNNKSEGVNGNYTLSGGTRNENASGSLNIKKGNVALSLSAGANAQLKGTTTNSLNWVSADGNNNAIAQVLQNGEGSVDRNSYRAQLGVEWEVTKQDNISAGVYYTDFSRNSSGSVTQQNSTFYPLPSDTTTTLTNNNKEMAKILDCNMGYVKKFKAEGQELSLNWQSSFIWGIVDFGNLQTYSLLNTPISGVIGNNKGTYGETNVTADYAHPFSKDMTLNTGLKGVHGWTNSKGNYSVLDINATPADYVSDNAQSLNFNYYRDIYAAYASFTTPLFKSYTLKIGLRDEETKINIPGVREYSYNTVAPSAVFSRKFERERTIKLSYSRRINRPQGDELNPFIDATNPSNLTQGNPDLLPEKQHTLDLSYSKFFKQGSSLIATVYYRYSEQDQQTYVIDTSFTLGSSNYKNVAITTDKNAATQQITGISIDGKLTVSRKLEIRGSAMFFDKYIVSDIVAGSTSNTYNYRIKVNGTYQFTKTLVAEIFGNFRSARTEIQGKFPSFSTYNIAIRKMLFDSKGSIAFTTTCPFNEYIDQPTNISGTNFTAVADRKVPYRSFGLNFTYKFGKMEFKDKKQEPDNVEEKN